MIVTKKIAQIARPNTLTIQYMESFSHLTVQLPSLSSSQIQELAQAIPAPVFCIITAVTENVSILCIEFSDSNNKQY